MIFLVEPFTIDVNKIKLHKVEMEGAEKAYMKWLISPENAPVSFSMRIFKIEPGGKIPEHKHWYYHEIFCVKGSGRVTIGGKEFRLKANMAAFVPPHIPHSYVNDRDEDWVFICVIPMKKECEEINNTVEA